MGKHVIGKVSELPPGQRKLVELEGRSIGVFNVHGEFYALRSQCPHQGAPLCKGSVKGMLLPSEPGQYLFARDGEILRCPWHGWEFDLKTGQSVYDPFKCRVRTYDVTVEPDDDEWPKAETYPVTVERGLIVVHV